MTATRTNKNSRKNNLKNVLKITQGYMVYLSCCPMENSPSLLQIQKLANGKLLFSLSLH